MSYIKDKKDKVEKVIITTRAFSYTKGSIVLNFSLNIDSTDDVFTFKKLLEAAIEDIDKVLVIDN